MTYEIIDNFLEKEDFNHLEKTLFSKDMDNPNKFVWNYHEGIVRDPEMGPTGYEEHDWMYNRPLYSSDCLFHGNRVFHSPQIWANSNNGLRYDRHYPIVKPIIDKLSIKKLFDVRANLLVPTKEHIYHESHVDRDEEHKVALFYVTDNNGWTVLKDTAKVECVKNRMLLFDGSIEHHSVSSTDELRCVVNMNYI